MPASRDTSGPQPSSCSRSCSSSSASARDAYLEPFAELASPAELRAAFGLAHRTGTIARALAWYRYFVGDPEAERDDTVAYGLKMFLADGPIGSWEP